jgi:hypothetical protein
MIPQYMDGERKGTPSVPMVAGMAEALLAWVVAEVGALNK